jgi:(R,R)-butanediol dehydrogenase/meso-butanediol dehydrogenase/diacetyl reductase
MRQLTYLGDRRLRLDETEPVALGPGQLRVAIDSVGICMSDVYGYGQVNDRRDVVLADGGTLVMGHEPSGVIAELGPGVQGPALGTPVAVNPVFGCGVCERCRAGAENLCEQRTVIGCVPSAPGGFADSLVVPAQQVVELPPGMSLEQGALAEPLTVGAHGVRLAGLTGSEDVVVIGGGIIGLGAALAARRHTDGEVVVVEPREHRRDLCATLCLSAVSPEAFHGDDAGFDVALDCVARPETFEGAIGAVGTSGLVVLVGIWQDYIPLPVSTVVWQETRILGSYGYSHSDFVDVVQWMGRGEAEVGALIENRVGFDGVIAAFDGYVDGTLHAVRTILQPAL